MKKLLTLVLALALIMSLAVPAFAATTDLVITDGSGYASKRDYEAYQVLTASVSGLDFAYQLNDKYTDILIDVLDLTFASDATNVVIHDGIIAGIMVAGADAEGMRHFAEELYAAILAAGVTPDAKWSGDSVTLDQGYWIIADVTDLEGTEYSNSLVIVDTVGDVKVEITNKPDVPDTDKKIDDENDSLIDPSNLSEDGVTLQDVADYDIGDDVPYTIGIDMPNNISEYSYYSFVIQDKASAGLTYNVDSFEITVNGEKKYIAANGVATVTDDDGVHNVDFWYEIVDTADGSELYVYPAHSYTTHELNTATTEDLTDYVTKAANKDNGGDYLKLFPAGTAHSIINSSEVVFNYTCTLNENAVIGVAGNPNKYTLKYSNNPYDDGFGETVEDTTIVLTYKAIFNKVDTDGNALEGAEFKLSKFIAVYPNTRELTADDLAQRSDWFNHPAANAWGYFEEIKLISTNAVADDPATTEDESKAATEFTFSGLDDGFYKLEETKVPKGFNGIEPVEFRITANHITEITNPNANVLTELNVATKVAGELTIVGDVATGSVEADIENRSGTELPHTGGMGTTLFYVLGTIMVLGAAVLLITKKRMTA